MYLGIATQSEPCGNCTPKWHTFRFTQAPSLRAISYVAYFTIFLAVFVSNSCHASEVPGWGDQEIVIAEISLPDIQIIQDALIWQGHYVGLKDGRWGPMTQTALDQFCRSRGRIAPCRLTPNIWVDLVGSAWKRKDDVGWTVHIDPKTNSSIGYPKKLVSASPQAGGATWSGTDYTGSNSFWLATRWQTGNFAETISYYEQLVQSPRPGKLTYRLNKPDRQVWVIEREGDLVYARYDLASYGWKGFFLSVKKDSPLQYLIAATTADFGANGIAVVQANQDYPLFHRILNWVDGQSKSVKPSPEPNIPSSDAANPAPAAPPTGHPKLASAGSGFFVSREGHFLTAAHVIDGCTKIMLPDGRELRLRGSDKKRDLALLVSTSTQSTFLYFSRDQNIELGQRAYVFGYPYFGTISTSLNLTDGIVTSLRGIADDPLIFQINANVQPGNSGGPVVSSSGGIIGVAIARLNELATLRETGSLPQSMNYAVRGSAVSSFLLEHSVYPEPERSATPLDASGVAKLVGSTVHPVLCFK